MDELARLTQRPYPHIPLPIAVEVHSSLYDCMVAEGVDVGLPVHINDELPLDPGYKIILRQPDGSEGPVVGPCSGPHVKAKPSPLTHPTYGQSS